MQNDIQNQERQDVKLLGEKKNQTNTGVLVQKETLTVQVYPKECQSVFLNGF